ncbi:Glutamyl-tRNA reductase [Caloramator mitchellensis]|uniref:Glutamyl-tRNA reductase n=1 Tax=Caloramator mitchellensis TaxID=908809 RepID=A0A0R3JR25_CALMK|nr:glutamyl-tRNA reductase [Caloramator mitchellensis]KRQ85910.1 Glutamyl-tRNA reductase [Caloramator mitchellensis]
MIAVLGVNPKVDIKIREKLSIIEKRIEDKLYALLKYTEEAVIISTCNRTEVYLSSEDLNYDEILNILGWTNFKEYVFIYEEKNAVKHLMQVACGFDSLILGEEQILGQVRHSLEIARDAGTCGSVLNRLFEMAVACGKEFRNRANLNKYPVSSASIVASEIQNRDIRNVLILGYGEVGQLVLKYILSKDIKKVYIAIRDIGKSENIDEKVKFIEFKDWKNYIRDVEAIVSATSAPHTVIKKEDIDKEMLIFDLAVPRDVEEDVRDVHGVTVLDIDEISNINQENINARKETMEKNKYLIDKYMSDFFEWLKLKEITPLFIQIQNFSDYVYKKRFRTFKNKYKNLDLRKAEMLFKSTADAFAERAISVLKEEYINGRGEECKRIIEKIFRE